LSQEQLHDDSDNLDLELGRASSTQDLPSGDFQQDSDDALDAQSLLHHTSSHPRPKWTWRFRIPSLHRSRPASRQGLLPGEKDHTPTSRKGRRKGPLSRILHCLAISLMLLGLLQIITLACGVLTAFFPDDFDWAVYYLRYSDTADGLNRWPTDSTADSNAVACHSHNDYWRPQPLFSAINAGCTGVEADVWLLDEELFVGHSTSSLTSDRTLRNLYINPLLDTLDKQNPTTDLDPTPDTPRNGVFDTDAAQSAVLLIDFKTKGEALWPYVHSQLEPLRAKRYLTYWNGEVLVEGPITVVVTGNAPFDRVIANTTYRDMFFDAPLDLLAEGADSNPPESLVDHAISEILPRDKPDQGQGRSGSVPTDPSVFSPANSYYASVSFKKSIGFLWYSPHLTDEQITKIRRQIAGAHAHGLKVRYWGTPSWPRGIRNSVWRVLMREGVDYLSVDDLGSATRAIGAHATKKLENGGPDLHATRIEIE